MCTLLKRLYLMTHPRWSTLLRTTAEFITLPLPWRRPTWPTTRFCFPELGRLQRRTTPSAPSSPPPRPPPNTQHCRDSPTYHPMDCTPPSCRSFTRQCKGDPLSPLQTFSCPPFPDLWDVPSPPSLRSMTTQRWNWNLKNCGRIFTSMGQRWSSPSLEGRRYVFPVT